MGFHTSFTATLKEEVQINTDKIRKFTIVTREPIFQEGKETSKTTFVSLLLFAQEAETFAKNIVPNETVFEARGIIEPEIYKDKQTQEPRQGYSLRKASWSFAATPYDPDKQGSGRSSGNGQGRSSAPSRTTAQEDEGDDAPAPQRRSAPQAPAAPRRQAPTPSYDDYNDQEFN